MVSPPPIQVATLGWEDSLILMVLALVVFGPRRLPLIGRQIGKLMYEFRKASNDFKFQMEEELRSAEEADRRKKEEAERQKVAVLAAESQASVSAPAPTVEAQAAMGAIEAPTASGYLEGEGSSSSAEPVIQPPRTGEPVSAGAAFSGAVAEVNPEADAVANAAGVEAQAEGPAESSTSLDTPVNGAGPNRESLDHRSDQDLSPGAPGKEPVSQHG